MAADRGSEFTGEQHPSNSLANKRKGEYLSPGERLRLIYQTGQDSDPTKAVDDGRAFHGWKRTPHSIVDAVTEED